MQDISCIFEKFFITLQYHTNNLIYNGQWSIVNVQWLDLSVVVNLLSSTFPDSQRCLPGASSGSGWITIHVSAVFSPSLVAPTEVRLIFAELGEPWSRAAATKIKWHLFSNKRNLQMLKETLAVLRKPLFLSVSQIVHCSIVQLFICSCKLFKQPHNNYII